MGLESATFVNDLDTANPVGAVDSRSQADDHLRLIKSVLKNTFPNGSRAFRFPRSQTKTGPYTILSSDQNNSPLVGDATGGAINLTLPSLAAGDDGWTIAIVKNDATANAVTIVGTINGASNLVLTRRYDVAVVMWTGSLWIAGVMRASIGSAELETNAVTQVKMADNSVGTAEIIDGNVTNPKLATDAVTAIKIQDGAVTNPKLAGPRVTVQTFLSGSGNWSRPAGCTAIKARWCGGGGGGGGRDANNGSTGGTSSFNGINALGGVGGSVGNANNGTGGTGGSGGSGSASFRVSGGDGDNGGGGQDPSPGGNGGVNPFGGSGRGGSPLSTTPLAGKANTGAGGGGAGDSGGGNGGGGGGGAGEYCELFISSPAASIAYVVGAGGAGGAAGTVAGADGGPGVVIVEEYY